MAYKDNTEWNDSFTEQQNKWGYLNNPRWFATPQPPVNYDGQEDEEPQIWKTLGDGLYSSEDSKKHIPCGHWHKKGAAMWGQISASQQSIAIDSDNTVAIVARMTIYDLDLNFLKYGLIWGFDEQFSDGTGFTIGGYLANEEGDNPSPLMPVFTEIEGDRLVVYDAEPPANNALGEYGRVYYIKGSELVSRVHVWTDLGFNRFSDDAGRPIYLYPDGTVIIATFTDAPDRGIYIAKSTDWGQTWGASVKIGTTTITPRDYIWIDKTDDGNLWLVMTEMGTGPAFRLFKSTDTGDTWTEIVTMPQYNGSTIKVLNYGNFTAIGNTLYIHGIQSTGGHYQVHYSADGGVTWINKYDPVGYGLDIAVAMGITTDSYMLFSGYTGPQSAEHVFYQSADNGDTATLVFTVTPLGGGEDRCNKTCALGTTHQIRRNADRVVWAECRFTASDDDYLGYLTTPDGITWDGINTTILIGLHQVDLNSINGL